MPNLGFAVQQRFQALLTAAQNEPAQYYWRVGHAFDTMLDYLLRDNAQAARAGDIAKAHFLAGGGAWYDDFAWWGIACQRAARMGLFTDPGSYAAMSDYCWHAMDGYAPWVWERADQARYQTFEPRFPGGVWNSTWKGPYSTIDCEPSVSDGLCGTQNTVTNTLYLLLASRLAAANSRQRAYFNAAAREYGFLRQWFDLNSVDDRLLGRATSSFDNVFVRERVGTYGKGGNYQRAWAYRPTLAWAGDQGLLLSGLAGMAALDGTHAVEYLARARLLLNGIATYLVVNGRFVPWRDQDNRGAPGGDDPDYQTGVGVLMRCLLDVYRNSVPLRDHMNQTNYKALVGNYANYVVSHPNDDNGVVGPANDVATLLLALAMGLS